MALAAGPAAAFDFAADCECWSSSFPFPLSATQDNYIVATATLSQVVNGSLVEIEVSTAAVLTEAGETFFVSNCWESAPLVDGSYSVEISLQGFTADDFSDPPTEEQLAAAAKRTAGTAEPITFSCEGPPSGGEGCTPGYWKQAQHFDSWVGFAPSDDFESVFGVDASFSPDTLLDALGRNGGGENALARHAVAALLSASSGDVEYAFSEAEVIDLVQDAYASGDFETIKNILAAENERACPLN